MAKMVTKQMPLTSNKLTTPSPKTGGITLSKTAARRLMGETKLKVVH